MPQIFPTYSGVLSDAERALVAGFLLHERGQILRGLEAARDPAAVQVGWWSRTVGQHFEAWEAHSRYLLYLLGYRVEKDLQYPEFSDADNETARIIRDVESRGWVADPGEDR